MSEDKLLKLAQSGQWKERAIELLQKRTNACLDVILSFVAEHWQNLESDEENIHNFEMYESDFQEAFSY